MRKFSPFAMVGSAAILLTLAFVIPTDAEYIRPEVTSYHRSVSAVEKSPKRQSLEPVFRLGNAAVRKLSLDVEAYAHKNWDKPNYNLENQFASVMKNMDGFYLGGYEGDAFILGPSYAYWDKLAGTKGLPADAEFFRLAHKQYPEYPGFTSFVRMEWDYGGCTLYGEGHLTPLYVGWTDYQKKNPGKYSTWVKESLDTVKMHLEPDPEHPICSCNGKAGFIKEVQSLTGKRPQDAITQKLIKLSKDPKIKFECHYG